MGFSDFFKKIAPVIPVVGDVVGGILTDKANKASAKAAMAANREAARNAHQWEVEDLRKAGLNPILSAHGGGANMAAAPVAQVGNSGRAVARGAADMLTRQLLKAQIEQTQATTANTQADTENKNIIGTDLENTNDMKWGTGGKPGQVSAENQGKLEEIKTRILEGRQRVTSAKETTRKEKMMNDALKEDPQLVKYVLSADYYERENISRLLDGSGSVADFARGLYRLFGR